MKKMSRHSFCAILVLFFLIAGCASPDEKRDAFMKKGQQLEEKQDFVRARLEYKNAVKIDPECVECYERLAKVNMALKDLKGAYASYVKASELAPERNDLQMAVARLLIVGRAPDKAEEKLRSILEKEPHNWDAKLLLAMALARQEGKQDEALSILEAYRTANPGKPEGYILAAKILARKKMTAQAENLLKKGMEKCQDKKAILQTLFAVYEKEQSLEKALKVAEELASLNPEDPANYLALAKIHEQMKAFDQAGKDWRTALEKAKNAPSLILAYAQFLLRAKKPVEAQKALEEGVKENPNNLDLRIGLAELLTKTGKAQDALKILQEADLEKASPARKLALKNAEAKVLLALGKTEESLSKIEEILKENPKDAQALLLKARIALLKKDGETSVAALRQLVDDAPKNAEYRLLLAQAHLINNDIKLAEDQLKQATQIDPGNIQAWITLARLQATQNDLEGALGTLSTAMKENPKSARLAYFSAVLNWKAKEYKKAEKFFKKAIDFKPTWLEPYRGLAALYANSSSKEKAEESLKKAVQAHPKAGNLKILLATFYEQTGEFEKAIKIYEELLEQAPDHPLVCNNLAYLYAENSKDPKILKKAMELVTRAESKVPGQATILDTKAWILYKSGRPQEALSTVEQALAKAEIPTLLYHKAVILSEVGQKEEARKILSGLVSNKRNFPEKKKAQQLLTELEGAT